MLLGSRDQTFSTTRSSSATGAKQDETSYVHDEWLSPPSLDA
jgi:hypothetical protein